MESLSTRGACRSLDARRCRTALRIRLQLILKRCLMKHHSIFSNVILYDINRHLETIQTGQFYATLINIWLIIYS